ncbi:hypothetical protein HY386_01070 [Candidatus Daviesbacteria bacterium]|nr:hypothetical protein [Candidatus Daviesbacteria bacterium]
MDLTDRQRALLKAIIEEYIDSAEPVGSEAVDKKYNLGVSPATIRNEMVHLTDMGYLKQPHTSAGRVPTSMGFRFYIQELMKEKQLPVAAEVSIKEDMWQERYQQDKLLRQAVKALAKQCDMLGLAIDSDNQIYYSGAANILDWPEFYDIDVTRFVLSLFDDLPVGGLQQIIGKAEGSDPIHILFGDELEFENLAPTGFIFTSYEMGPKSGVIGVIGPARMNFPLVIPYVKYIRDLIYEAGRSW